VDEIRSEKKIKSRRNSIGRRKIETMDRIFLFFIRLRHNWSFYMLSIFFGVAEQSASNYFEEVLHILQEEFVPRLFFFPTRDEVEPHIPNDFKTAFPGVFFIGDGVLIRTGTSENFALNSLTFCIYKWHPGLQLVVSKYYLV
jgi:hypothetical protein